MGFRVLWRGGEVEIGAILQTLKVDNSVVSFDLELCKISDGSSLLTENDWRGGNVHQPREALHPEEALEYFPEQMKRYELLTQQYNENKQFQKRGDTKRLKEGKEHGAQLVCK